ncbi:ferric aerobactin receptor precursur IutA domain protein, partial [Vibrio parahaemolyticus V-223/04]
HT